jgi:hypothetical protein
MLQFAKGNRSKSVQHIEKEGESVVANYLNDVTGQWRKSADAEEIILMQGTVAGICSNSPWRTATKLIQFLIDIALFLASQCIPAMSQRGLNTLDNEVCISIDGFCNSSL